jgi:hypothetical protein
MFLISFIQPVQRNWLPTGIDENRPKPGFSDTNCTNQHEGEIQTAGDISTGDGTDYMDQNKLKITVSIRFIRS